MPYNTFHELVTDAGDTGVNVLLVHSTVQLVPEAMFAQQVLDSVKLFLRLVGFMKFLISLTLLWELLFMVMKLNLS